MRIARRFVGLAAVIAAAGCSAGDLIAPDAAGNALAFGVNQSAASVADISGSWTLSRVLQLTVPPWAAELIFGIEPEGPVTHLRCETSGTMELTQSNGTFGGTAVATGTCETKGGQVFSRGGAEISILDGEIRGQSVAFTWAEDGMLFCPYHGVISQDEAGQMSGTGRCIIPGHPKSGAPLPPPPGGTSNTLSWIAVRQ
jgi:hypothetical protein